MQGMRERIHLPTGLILGETLHILSVFICKTDHSPQGDLLALENCW